MLLVREADGGDGDGARGGGRRAGKRRGGRGGLDGGGRRLRCGGAQRRGGALRGVTRLPGRGERRVLVDVAGRAGGGGDVVDVRADRRCLRRGSECEREWAGQRGRRDAAGCVPPERAGGAGVGRRLTVARKAELASMAEAPKTLLARTSSIAARSSSVRCLTVGSCLMSSSGRRQQRAASGARTARVLSGTHAGA